MLDEYDIYTYSFIHVFFDLDHHFWYRYSSLVISSSNAVLGCLIVWLGVLYQYMWMSRLNFSDYGRVCGEA